MKEKEFVPYDLALRLKALGFKERTLTYYEDGKPKLHDAIEGWDFNSSFLTCISRPIFSQVFKWFRDKYETISVIEFSNDGEYWKDVKYNVTISEFKYFATHDSFVKYGYKTYEEAELDCLVKLIEIIEKDK